jgi:antibiotic biosynthesis monooxygenase (ABM) superfamily enzyme
MTPTLSAAQPSRAEPVKIVFERHVRPGADAAFREWSQRFVQAAKRFPGHEGASVLAVPNSASQFVLVRFASGPDLERWQDSDEYAALIREADRLGPAGEYSETRTGMETWFTLPGKPMPAKPPANWKMALTTWVGLFPMVVALGYILRPLRMPGLFEQAVSTIIPTVMLTWVVMPAFTRWLYRWLYPDTTT